jgi:hypothetical protein
LAVIRATTRASGVQGLSHKSRGEMREKVRSELKPSIKQYDRVLTHFSLYFTISRNK